VTLNFRCIQVEGVSSFFAEKIDEISVHTREFFFKGRKTVRKCVGGND
jgi:hypothetical protein